MFKNISSFILAGLLCVLGSFAPTAYAASAASSYICPSASHTGASMATLTTKNFTLTCPGAVVGDFVDVSTATDLLLLQVTAYVSAANTVTITLFNPTAGSVTDPTAVYYVRVWPRYKSP